MKIFIRTLIKLAISPIVLWFSLSCFCLGLIQTVGVWTVNSFAWIFDFKKLPVERPPHFYISLDLLWFLVSDFVPKTYGTFEEYLDSLPKSASSKGEN